MINLFIANTTVVGMQIPTIWKRTTWFEVNGSLQLVEYELSLVNYEANA